MTLVNHSLKPAAAAVSQSSLVAALVADMSNKDLLEVRQMVDAKLRLDLKHMNLADELAITYRHAQVLLDDVQKGQASVPANQRAQVLNSIKDAIAGMIKLGEKAYSQERLKRLEAAIIGALRAIPDKNAQEAFFDRYQDYIKEMPPLELPT